MSQMYNEQLVFLSQPHQNLRVICFAPGRAGSKPKKIDISVNDRVSVFLELAEAHRILGQQVRVHFRVFNEQLCLRDVSAQIEATQGETRF